MIHQKDYDNKNVKEKTTKYNLYGKSERSIRWFDLDHEWLEENISTREPYFFNKNIKQILGVMRQKKLLYQFVMQK